MSLKIYVSKNKLVSLFMVLLLGSCSTMNSTWDSISEAGDYIYDSVVFWEDDEPEQEQAIVIEEAIEVPEFAVPEQTFESQIYNDQNMPQPPETENFQNPYFDPVYRSARQYFYVTPNGTPMPAPPPPPFPQYSIEKDMGERDFYGSNFDYLPRNSRNSYKQVSPNNSTNPQSSQDFLSEEEQMEIYGIQNDCIRVEVDYMNGGFRCDDTDSY